jgi:hypothetical protein
MSGEHNYYGKVTGIYEVEDAEVAARTPYLIALDEGKGGFPSAAHKIVVSAAGRALFNVGDDARLSFRDVGWDTELIGFWVAEQKID